MRECLFEAPVSELRLREGLADPEASSLDQRTLRLTDRDRGMCSKSFRCKGMKRQGEIPSSLSLCPRFLFPPLLAPVLRLPYLPLPTPLYPYPTPRPSPPCDPTPPWKPCPNAKRNDRRPGRQCFITPTCFLFISVNTFELILFFSRSLCGGFEM